ASMMADTAASYLGLTRDELIAQVQSGQTLAHVAVAPGKSVVGLIDALVAAGTAQCDQKAADGTPTAARRDCVFSQMKARSSAVVNGGGRPSFGAPGGPFSGSSTGSFAGPSATGASPAGFAGG